MFATSIVSVVPCLLRLSGITPIMLETQVVSVTCYVCHAPVASAISVTCCFCHVTCICRVCYFCHVCYVCYFCHARSGRSRQLRRSHQSRVLQPSCDKRFTLICTKLSLPLPLNQSKHTNIPTRIHNLDATTQIKEDDTK